MSLVILFFFCVASLFFDLFYMFCFFFLFVLALSVGWGGFFFGGVMFLDKISFFLVFLSCLIFLYCVFSSLVDMWTKNFFGYFSFFLGLIFMCLVLSFTCLNFVFFYVCFEFIFVLMYFFLLSWGYSPERLSASFYMVFYTLVVSFPFLIYLISMSSIGMKFLLVQESIGYWWVVMFLVFMVKLPVYGVHLWLPKAHVEAPVSGSMVLAGVLLKLGTYGFLRFSGILCGNLVFFGGYLVSVGLVGGLISCYLCLRQVDLKSFVAYSSVCHMGFGLGGLYSGSYLGWQGSIYMMVAHGFCSSCLFYILYVFYERFYTRSGVVLKGVGYLFPMMMLVWFSFCALNMGVPPSFSFFSEVLLLCGMSGFSIITMLFSGILLLFAGFYGIYFYVISCHSVGLLEGWAFSFSLREYLNFYSHFFFLLFVIFSLDYFLF